MTTHAADQDLREARPARGVLVRHRGADLDVHDLGGPRVDLRRGAVWIRVGEEGPGVTVTYGAASVPLRTGAVVVEAHGGEALLLVASGQAAVKGTSPLPRSVVAGQAVVLAADGTTSEPDRLSATELAADRMVVENLARDLLAARDPVPVDLSGIGVLVGDAPLPRLRPRPELVLRSEVLSVRNEPSALETALANVGVTDTPLGPVAGAATTEHPLEVEPDDELDPGESALAPDEGVDLDDVDVDVDEDELGSFIEPDDDPQVEDASSVEAPIQPGWVEERRARRRRVLALIIAALVLLAVFAAAVLSSSS